MSKNQEMNNNYWVHFPSHKSISDNLQNIGTPDIISLIGDDISAGFANTKHDLDSIKDRALPLTFKYGLSVCDKNSAHYNAEKCESFLLNVNSIHQNVYSTIYHSGSNYQLTDRYLHSI